MTTSGSGPDPDVSPANARLQAGRIANTRSVATVQVQALIDGRIQPAVLGFIGQPRVNVLAVNRALGARFPLAHPGTP